MSLLYLQKYCGKKSEMGEVIKTLRKVYSSAKTEAGSQFEEILNEGSSSSSQSCASESDVGESLDRMAFKNFLITCP